MKTNILLKAIHDLKAPITSISCFIEMLENSLDEKYRESYIPRIKLSLQQLLKEINTLHSLVNLESEECKYLPQIFNLAEMLNIITSEFNAKWLKEVKFELDVDNSHVIKGDPFMFKQIVEGLLDELKNQDVIYITSRLKNKVIGVSIGNQTDILDKGEIEIDGEKSLSLLLSSELVKLHGGKLKLFMKDSEKTFYFTLPVIEKVSSSVIHCK